jgi:hypothetical protein
MLGNKNHLLGIMVLLIASVGLYYGTRTEEDKLASAMESAVDDHEREEALIYASKLLELQPGHPQAKRVIAKSVKIFTQLQAAREGLSEFWNGPGAAPLDAETLYRELQESRKHLAKAKNIDKEFETTLEFEKKLDEAQAQLVYLFASNALAIGNDTVSKVSEEYEKLSHIFKSAESSGYLSRFLSVNSPWLSVGSTDPSAKIELEEKLVKMNDVESLVAEYPGESAKRVVRSLQAYTKSVRKTMDTLLTPNGNYHDFIKSAGKGKRSFKKAQQRLAGRIPDSFDATDDYADLLKGIYEYDLFENQIAPAILGKNQTL